MKKTIIITGSIIIVIIAAVTGYRYFASFHKVSVEMADGVTKATIYKQSGEDNHEDPFAGSTKAAELSESKDVSLQNGKYLVKLEGKDISQEPVYFTVNDRPLNVKIAPDASDDFLSKQLATEQLAITQAMVALYPIINSDYTISNGTLYKKGEWYGALLFRRVNDPREEPDYYRILVHKEGSTWKVVNSPQLVLTTAEFKDVPVEILKAINSLSR